LPWELLCNQTLANVRGQRAGSAICQSRA